jgi:hypothetical protein
VVTEHGHDIWSKLTFFCTEALSPAFIHGADLWPHPINFASAEQLQQLQQQVRIHSAHAPYTSFPAIFSNTQLFQYSCIDVSAGAAATSRVAAPAAGEELSLTAWSADLR